MRLTLYEYLAPPDQEQYDIIFTIGEFLEISFKANKRFVWYSVNRFFVDVEYSNADNRIAKNRAFVTGEILDKYTDH